MRPDANVADGDTPLAALMRETAAATVDTILAELRRRPIVYPEWLSLQDAAAYTGYSEQQFSDCRSLRSPGLHRRPRTGISLKRNPAPPATSPSCGRRPLHHPGGPGRSNAPRRIPRPPPAKG